MDIVIRKIAQSTSTKATILPILIFILSIIASMLIFTSM